MKRIKFYRMIAGILVITMAITLYPANQSAAKQSTNQKMVTKSSIGDAVTKVVPEKETAKEQLSEAKTEDESDNETAYPSDFRKFTVKSDGAAASSGLTGQCGDNVQYEIDASTGHVVIRGTGAMKDYEHPILHFAHIPARSHPLRSKAASPRWVPIHLLFVMI